MSKKFIKVFFCTLLSIMLIGCSGISNGGKESSLEKEKNEVTTKTDEELAAQYNATTIKLDDTQILVDDKKVSSTDSEAVYAANDIVFYLEGQDFTYGEGTEADEHSQAVADAHTVVHITQPGNYVVSGTLSKGQIAIDLGDGAKKEEDAVVTLILNNADITCEVAPAVIFYNVYECGSKDEEDATMDVDTADAGANVIIADGSENNVTGSYVARIYESVELNEDGTEIVDSKKLHKYDAAFYSRRSMNITGEEENTGILNIHAENEGLDTELHLTINGGNINITSGNDGINTNEDGISVTTINGGNLSIVVDGSTGEGDGIDSNGWLVINGGTVTAAACSFSMDSGIDSDMGIHINGGTVLATGNMFDEIADSEQNYVVFTFDDSQQAGTSYELLTADGDIVETWIAANDFSMLVFGGENLSVGTYSLYKNGEQVSVQESNGMPGFRGGMPGGKRPEMPQGGLHEGMEMPQMPEGEFPQMPKNGEVLEFPEGMEIPEGENPPMFDKGERPQMPEDMEMPFDEDTGLELWGGKMQEAHYGDETAESTTEFEIKVGGNMFRVITAEE